MTMTRKEFFGTVVSWSIGALGLVTLSAGAGCGGGDSTSADAPGGGGNCLQNGTTVTIGSNHGHVMVVSKADVMAAADKTYDIMGTALHTHSVTVTAAQFGKLATNMSIMVTSTVTDAHSHDITVVCA